MDIEYDSEDIYDELATIMDPEKPCTLADLDVVTRDRCSVKYLPERKSDTPVVAPPLPPGTVARQKRKRRRALVSVMLKPTVPHCHLMSLIALSVRARLYETLPVQTEWKVDIKVMKGSHNQEEEIERQVNDKERVCAALENPPLRKEVEKLINPEAE